MQRQWETALKIDLAFTLKENDGNRWRVWLRSEQRKVGQRWVIMW